MKRLIFTSAFLLAISIGILAQTSHTVGISGLNFVPFNLAISVGDRVVFNGSSNHPIAEVSEDTWNANSNTPLSGGFSFSSGSGNEVFNTIGTYYYICENHYSTGMKGKITVSALTSVNDIADHEFNIFPNPLNDDILTISLNTNPKSLLEITIFDITGTSKVFKSTIPDKNQVILDCSDLLSGIYIVQINLDNKISSTKLVKR